MDRILKLFKELGSKLAQMSVCQESHYLPRMYSENGLEPQKLNIIQTWRRYRSLKASENSRVDFFFFNTQSGQHHYTT